MRNGWPGEMRIYNLEPEHFAPEDLRRLDSLGTLECDADSLARPSAIVAFQPDVLITRLGFRTDAALLAQLTRLRYIVSCTTGLNHIDLDYCRDQGLEVLSLKGESDFLQNITSTAEHTWFLVLALLRQGPLLQAKVASGSWNRKDFFCREAREQTLGIIGLGRLGTILLKYAEAFGMQVLATDRNPGKESLVKAGSFVSLTQLLERSDIICLMVDYSEENRHLISGTEFAQIKNVGFFVNTARGELVDENALLEALRSGRLSGAALDVLEGDSEWSDSVPPGNALWNYAMEHDNLIITPHVGGHSLEAIHKTRAFMVRKLELALDKSAPGFD